MTSLALEPQTKSRNLKRYATGWPAAIVILLLYWLMATTAWQTKCTTFDERENIAAGLGYWRTGDLRLCGDDCILPKLLPTLPIALGHYNFPPENDPMWLIAYHRAVSHQVFYTLGNDPAHMLYLARATMALVTVLTGLIAYGWSRRLFGRAGGMVSVLLFAFCPLMLSHGALATSDVLGTFFFLASITALWVMLHRITWWTVLASTLTVGLFFISKLTAMTIVPIGLLMAAFRIWMGPPLRIEFGRVWLVSSKARQAAIFAGLVLVHIAVAAVIIWRAYDFKFAAFSSASLAIDPTHQVAFYENLWAAFLPKEGFSRELLLFFRTHHLLPDRYLLGVAGVIGTVEYHPMFADGFYSNTGFWWFFPYALWVKTPLGLFLILVLALLAAADIWRRLPEEQRSQKPVMLALQRLYQVSPLAIALLMYWVAALRSNLNIGVRHLLPTFPVMYILAGAAAYWLVQRRGLCTAVLAAALGWFIAASVLVRPNYLTYFNETVGGSANGYHHLVDSSLDWGQDLPALRNYLDSNHLNFDGNGKTPVYLCYFGAGNARYYGIKAMILPGFLDQPEEDPSLFHFRGGIYCISATMLSGVYTTPGGWNHEYERRYQETQNFLIQYSQWDQHPELNKKYTPQQRREMGEELVREMRALGLGRMLAYLRHRTPDENINNSIFIFKLTEDEIPTALGGPPAEMLDTDNLLPGPPQ